MEGRASEALTARCPSHHLIPDHQCNGGCKADRRKHKEEITMLTLINQNLWMTRAAIVFSLVLICLTSVRADKVTDWNAVASQVLLNTNRGGAQGLIDLAYVHIAVYDAVNAIDGEPYTIFAVRPTSVPSGASAEAATVEAAYRVLIDRFPGQAAYLNAQYTASLATIPNNQSKTDGIAIGGEVAALFLTSRAGDGWNANITIPLGSGPGAWIPTSAAAPAVQWAARMRPFGIRSNDQFRADPPPALSSDEWASDYNEVKRFGSISSTDRTEGQTALARFFLAPGAPQLSAGIRQLSADHGLTLSENARLFALVYVSGGDASIAGMESKYHHQLWRPITAIRAGDTDGNPNTEPDPQWTPLSTTPNHPEYPSAHAFGTGAVAEALRQFFGTKKLHMTLQSSVTGTSMTFESTDELTKAVDDARIFAGFHYRTACVRGGVLGMRVAKYVSRRYFLPVKSE